MQVTLASRRSPDATSNEDFLAATASAVVVIDGASVPPELGTGCRHGTAWFARQLGTQLLAPAHHPARPFPSRQPGAGDHHRGRPPCRHLRPRPYRQPVGHRCRPCEQPEAVDYLVLGDTTILLEEPAGIRVVTDDRLEHVAGVQHRAMHEHATGSADHARSFAELVTEQRRHRNHPDGFWVASTDPDAARHALILQP